MNGARSARDIRYFRQLFRAPHAQERHGGSRCSRNAQRHPAPCGCYPGRRRGRLR